MKPSQKGIEIKPLWEEYVVCKSHRGEKNVGFIYALSDPDTKHIRYIGQTKLDVRRRYIKHISDSKRRNTHVSNWIRKLVSEGKKPILWTLEECWVWELDEHEIRHIAANLKSGYLTNISFGGQATKRFSEETKRKISNTLKGKKQSEETKLKRKISVTKAWADGKLREEQSQRVKLLHKSGVFSRNGKRKAEREEATDMILDYQNISFKVTEIAKKYNVCRDTVTEVMKRNNIPLRHPVKYDRQK